MPTPRGCRVLFFLLLTGNTVIQVKANYEWSECENRVLKIQSGEIVFNGIDNSTIDSYIYSGPVTGVHPNFPRENYLALTYQGCKEVCGNPIAWYSPETSLALVANWIFPLNILLSLPFESLHEGKFHRTLIAVLNWLGSPQTALTATIFNFRQLRQSHRRVSRDVNTYRSYLRCAAYFVLCSVNQFHIETQALRVQEDGSASRMLNVLVYGLFRPLSLSDESTSPNSPSPDVELTRQLLVNLAFQLRMLRRRGVIPMLANLATFLVAFIFSVVLAFAELGDESSPFSLSFGLLVTWLPLLVVFTVVDRNPISSERSAELISRWLYNVEAVEEWADTSRNSTRTTNPIDSEPSSPPLDMIQHITSSDTQPTLFGPESPSPKPSTMDVHNIRWWTTRTKIPPELQVEEFIGQGRKIQYCSIPHAFLEVTEKVDFSMATSNQLDECASAVARKLQGGRPLAWYVVAMLSFLLVWTAIISAFVVSFTAPTVGLGCRTMTYLIFGGSSSITWAIQFRKRPNRVLVYLSYMCNTIALLALLVVVIFQITGLASNCFCKSSALNMPLLGGYIDFKGYGFYKTHFNVIPFWIGASVIGALVPTIAFVVALFWWIKCRHLWKANERPKEPEYPLWKYRACTEWLQ